MPTDDVHGLKYVLVRAPDGGAQHVMSSTGRRHKDHRWNPRDSGGQLERGTFGGQSKSCHLPHLESHGVDESDYSDGAGAQ